MDEGQPTVLVVEDNELLRYTIERTLSGYGFTVLDAGTAEQGMTLFEANPGVALAILDMVLPGKSGLDMAAEIERKCPGFSILYMSGFSDSIAMESIARRAPNRVLLKPFGERLLLQRVTALLETGVERAGPGRSSTPTGGAAFEFPWERLLEASDTLAGASLEIMAYRDTAAGFAIAITHVAVLRAAGVPYTFRPRENTAMPLGLTVTEDKRAQALTLIERIGLGADIAPAA